MKYHFNISRFLSVLLVVFSFSSCTTIEYKSLAPKRAHDAADAVAKNHGFTHRMVKGGEFLFTTYQKITDTSAEYVVYIEGDGSIVDKGMPSNNPTPIHPMVLELATKDRRANIVYIARPCQYTPMELNLKCEPSYWSDKRWSEDSVDAMNSAIKSIVGNKKIHLVGFSGGGGIAVLIAARNPAVKDIITLAGNLDHVSFNKYHGAFQCLNSLNPIDYAKSINQVLQIHFSGSKDKKVPSFIADSFVKASGSNCVHSEVLADVTHNRGWIKNIEYILRAPLGCY